MSEPGLVEKIDAAIANFFSTGNASTVVLAGVLVIILLWPILTGKEPDIHPYLLARQAQASPVRQPGESSVYRINEIPIGYPLRSGLGVKDAGAPAWQLGRNGDLRDVWKRTVTGASDPKDGTPGTTGKLLTILGRERVIEVGLKDVTQAINTIGPFIQGKGGKSVAISLSNSVELLVAIFAAAFYGFKPVLIPYGLEEKSLEALLSKTSADVLIAEAGSIELKSSLSAAPTIKQVIWVAKEGSKHLDWDEVPEGVTGVEIATWHNLVEDQKASTEVPTWETTSKTEPISFFCKGKGGQHELREYTPGNIVAGIGGLLTTLVRKQRMDNKDVLLSTAPLTETYAFCWTMAALFSNATVALTSVAGDSVDLNLAVMGVSPTIIVSSAGTVVKYHQKIAGVASGLLQKISNYFRESDMRAGVMSLKKPSSIESKLSALRVLLISQTATDETKISSSILAGLRLVLGARISYALTAPSVAGAVTQTNILDYRDKGGLVSIGVPVASVELFLAGDDKALDRDTPEGKIVVRGPAVLGGQAELNVPARIELDRTLTLL